MNRMHSKTRPAPPANPLYGKPRAYSPITYAPLGMLERDEDDPVKLRWWANNCDKLAVFMESLQPERHKQSTWVEQDDDDARKNACGTAACALGWAALSQIIPGLQYCINENNTRWLSEGALDFRPTCNGEKDHFDYVGAKFFGYDVQDNIFDRAGISRTAIILMLRNFANEYREQADRG